MKLSRFLWIVTILVVIVGFVCGVLGALLEWRESGGTGLFLIVLCGMLLALSSLMGTYAAKKQSEEEKK